MLDANLLFVYLNVLTRQKCETLKKVVSKEAVQGSLFR